MEFSRLIPKAAAAIIEENPKIMKKCMGCEYPCDITTKFICLGFSALNIGNYLQKHPTFVQDIEEEEALNNPYSIFDEEEQDIEMLFDEEEK